MSEIKGSEYKMTYFEIAKKRFEQLDDMFKVAENHDWYNDLAVCCQQIAECCLKAVFESYLMDIDSKADLELLSEKHNLVTIAKRANEKFGPTYKIDDCALLQEYYFNVRYPGDNFIDVTKYDAETAINIAKAIMESTATLMG